MFVSNTICVSFQIYTSILNTHIVMEPLDLCCDTWIFGILWWSFLGFGIEDDEKSMETDTERPGTSTAESTTIKTEPEETEVEKVDLDFEMEDLDLEMEDLILELLGGCNFIGGSSDLFPKLYCDDLGRGAPDFVGNLSDIDSMCCYEFELFVGYPMVLCTQARVQKHRRVQIFSKIQDDLNAVEAQIKAALSGIPYSLQRLKEIALHGNPKTHEERGRIYGLNDLRRLAWDICDLNTSDFDLFKTGEFYLWKKMPEMCY